MTNMARLEYSVCVECPLCKQDTDLIDEDNDAESRISRPLFNNDWEKLKGLDVVCGNCEHEFELDGLEY